MHFPEQLSLAEKLVKDVEDPARLQDVMLKISTAQDEREATLALTELALQA